MNLLVQLAIRLFTYFPDVTIHKHRKTINVLVDLQALYEILVLIILRKIIVDIIPHLYLLSISLQAQLFHLVVNLCSLNHFIT